MKIINCCFELFAALFVLLTLAVADLQAGPASFSPADYDDDGIVNASDLDNDNDGILDTAEGACLSTGLIEWNQYSLGTDPDWLTPVDLDLTVTVRINDPFGIENAFTNSIDDETTTGGEYAIELEQTPTTLAQYQLLSLAFSHSVSGLSFIVRDVDKAPSNTRDDQLIIRGYSGGSVYSLTTSDFTLGTTNVFSGSNTFTGTTDNVQPSQDGNVTISFPVTIDSVQFEFSNSNPAVNGPQFLSIGNISYTSCESRDTDGDGLPDFRDLDSDNDGCPDAIEAAGSFSSANLQNDSLIGGVDANGIPNLVSPGGQATTPDVIDSMASNSCAPMAIDDLENTFEELPGIFNLTSNDTAPNGVNLTLTATMNGPPNGVVNIISDSDIIYSPDNDFFGKDTFDYIVCNDGPPVLCDTARVIVTVTNLNDPPAAVNDNLSVSQDTTNVIINVQSNDDDADGDLLTSSIISGPTSGGTAIIVNGDSIDYTPAALFYGSDTIVYSICDPGTECDTAYVLINVSSGNNAPIATDDAESTFEEIPGIFNLTANDTDPDGDDLFINSFFDGPANGIVNISTDSTITYTPNTFFFGMDTLNYEVCDSGMPSRCDTAQVVITVFNINDVPNAADDTFSVFQDTMNNVLDVQLNDTDVDFHALTTSILSGPTSGGTVLVVNSDSIDYSPPLGFFGFDTLIYSICDPGSYCDTAVVFINVIEGNDPPVATDDSSNTLEDISATINLTANDSDINGDSLITTAIQNGPTNGVVTISTDSTVIYTPNSNFFGIDTFSYLVCDDGLPALCDTGRVIISVTSVNDAPFANNDTASTFEEIPWIVNLTSNDVDVEGDYLFIDTTFNGPSNGMVNISTDSTIIYSPNLDFFGMDTFYYQVCDSSTPVLCDTAQTVIAVLNINDAPNAVNDLFSVDQDTMNVIIDVQANDSDVDLQVLTTAVISGPTSGGTAIVVNSDSIDYTPLGGFSGLDTFMYSVCDPGSFCDTAIVVISVLGPNNAPVANNDAENTFEELPAIINLTANDNDPDGNDLNITTTFDGPANGIVNISTDSTVIYSPNTDFFGMDTFSYVICDDGLPVLCDSGQVIVTVTNLNDPPAAIDDSRSVPEDTTNVFIDVQANDNDVDGDALTTAIISGPTSGGTAIVLNGDSIDYTPPPAFNGHDTIFYSVCDAGIACDTAIVVIEVGSINDAPVAIDDNLSTAQDTANVIIDVQANDSDVDGDTLTTTIVNGPTGGGTALVINSDSIDYTPAVAFNGLDTIVYAICDPGNACDTALVVINVIETNIAPLANDDAANTFEELPAIVDVTANDSDPNGNMLTITATLNGPANGIANIGSDSTIIYSPNTDFFGMDTMSYIVCDNGIPSFCDTARVVITVTNLNDPPVALDDNLSIDEDTVNVIIDVQVNDTDADGDVLTTAILSAPTSGGLAIIVNADSIDYSPPTSYNGIDTIIYSICDGSSACDTGLIIIDVGSVNDAPVAIDDNISTAEDTTNVVIDVQLNDTDADGDLLTTFVVTGPISGGTAFTINSDSINYTPAGGFSGLDSFTYSVCDPMGACDTAVVVVNISSMNQPPLAANDAANTFEEIPAIINLTSNDNDPDGHQMTITQTFNGPVNGIVNLVTDSTVVYGPNTDFFGMDTFSYVVCDDRTPALCDTAQTIVTVININDAPVAVDDVLAVMVDTMNVIIDVQGNDIDVDFHILTTAIIAGPTSGGTANLLNADSIDYTPPGGFTGADTIIYSICDPGSFCDTAIVLISVLGSNSAPVASNDAGNTFEELPAIINLTLNDNDLNGDNLTITATGNGPANGIVNISTDSTVIYWPNTDFFGLDSFSYIVCDDGLPSLCDTASVEVTVTNLNDAPVAVNDNLSTVEDTMNVIIDVQANDGDVDGDLLTTTAVSSPTSGGSAIIINGDSINYTPAISFNGFDTIAYAVCDPGSACDTALIIIEVGGVNDVPVAANDAASTPEETQIIVDVQSNDSDSDMDELLTTILSGPANGSAAVLNADSISYTPATDFNGNDTITYIVNDGNGGTDTAIFVITVTPVADPPVAVNDFAITNQDSMVLIPALGNDSDPDNNINPYSPLLVVFPSLGTITYDTLSGIVTYMPNLGVSGVDTMVYSLCDSTFLCDTAIIVVTINDVDYAPVAFADSVSTMEDSSVTIAVLANDVDLDNDIDPGSVSDVSLPVNGMIFINPVNGQIIYTPGPNFVGNDVMVYSVCDSSMLCDTATVFIEVTPVDDRPDAIEDTETTLEDIAITVDVLSNDTDTENNINPGSVSILSPPVSGNTAINPMTGEITYIPDANTNGADIFTYIVCDSTLLCDTSSVTINVTPVPDAPDANNDPVTGAEDTALIVDVLANDTDVEGDINPSSVTEVQPPSNGMASINPVTGAITYTPDPDFSGLDTIVYAVCDSTALCDSAQVLITITPVSEAPMANADTATVNEDDQVTISVLSNDTDAEGDINPSSVVAIATPLNGSTLVNPVTGQITYTPDPDYNGADNFSYVVCDSTALCDTATVTITVTPVADPPVATDDYAVTMQDSAVIVLILANDTDPENDIKPASVVAIGLPTNGMIGFDTLTGALTYTPNTAYQGNDTLTYIVCDSTLLCDTATVVIFVSDAIDPPTALKDTAIVDEDSSVVISVLANDMDADNNIDPSNVKELLAPVNGSTMVNPTTGEITYAPAANFNGTDSFTYIVCDSTLLCDTALVFVNVTPVADAPVALDDLSNADRDSSVVVMVINNDSDVDGDLDPTAVVEVVAPSNGSTSIDTMTGAITYVPNALFLGTDSFAYAVCDSTLLCDTAWVFITVNPVADPPVAANDSVITNEDVVAIINVLANDTDFQDNIDSGSVAAVTLPGNGQLSINGTTGMITYIPDEHFNGSDAFTYVVCDSTLLCDTASVTLTINPVADAPEAIDDIATTQQDVAVLVVVLNNDSDVDGDLDAGSVTELVSPAHGLTFIDPVSGAVTYIPNTGYTGVDSFMYIICDSTLLCDTASVFITVNPVNTAPIAMDDAASTMQDNAVMIAVLNNDTDTEGNIDPATVAEVTPPSNGALDIDSLTGSVTYTPEVSFSGIDSFAYAVCDSGAPSLCDTAWVVITVAPAAATAPQAADDLIVIAEDSVLVIQVLSNDTDAENNINPSAVSELTVPVNGIIVINPQTGSFTFIPDLNFNGVDSFSYVVCDSTLLCDTATVFITVTPVNDAPQAMDDTARLVAGDSATVDLITNDTDIEGSIDPSSADVVVLPSNGTAAIDPLTGALTYIPDSGFSGMDTIQYEICDTGMPVLCDTAFVILTVDSVPAVNQPPVAMMDSVISIAAQPVDILVLINDSDPDGDSIFVSSIASGPQHGAVVINNDGSITYVSDPGYSGMDQLTYAICDNGQPVLCEVSTVTISVIGIDANDDVMETNSQSIVDIMILANDNLPGGLDTSIVTSINPMVGTAIVNPDGSVTYTPNPNGNGIDSFQYEVCVMIDSSMMACRTAWVFVDVDPQDVTFPNGFSPNNDGVNDFFGVLGLQSYPNATLSVYNRYGDEVWNSGGPYNNDWGGTNFNGKPLPDGTYYYIIEFNDGRTEPASMFVQLHRGTRN